MYSRRKFLRSAGYAGALSMLGPYNGLVCNAQASSSSDYKAIVCLFLYGGNDSNNVLIPTDPIGYSAYAQGRGPVAIPQQQLLPLEGVPYAVHPSMPEVQSLFAAKNLAFIANVGNLVAPITMQQYNSGIVSVPQNIMSHSDQVAISQTSAPTSNIQTGWGGGIADAIGSVVGTAQLPTAISYYGAAAFINGVTSPGFISPGQGGSLFCAENGACAQMQQALNEMMAASENAARVQSDQYMLSQMFALDKVYGNAISQAQPFKTPLPANANGGYTQFTQIAQLIEARGRLGAQRQVFFTGLGSFDTHANQNAYQSSLLAPVSGAINYFAELLQEINMLNNVTLVTLSDFNRTLQPNSSGGTDHAWGGHQIVFGGAVKGGNIYGTFPNLTLGGPDDFTLQGRWLPTTSVSQVGATLASWFGVPDASLASVFPGIGNFPNPKLSFI
jgi:uncharacterized protein (DUF1501 family)